MDNRSIIRVDQLLDEEPISLRNLQRRFHDYVGISPKETIQRYRLIEAAETLRRQKALDFAALAHELRYSDQAHFIRDFKRMVGMTPKAYVEKMAEGQ